MREASRASGVCAWLSIRRAAWLYATPRSGVNDEAKRPKLDGQLAKALRGVAKRHPQWGYRLAGGFLQQRGWRVNLKRVHRSPGQHRTPIRTTRFPGPGKPCTGWSEEIISLRPYIKFYRPGQGQASRFYRQASNWPDILRLFLL